MRRTDSRKKPFAVLLAVLMLLVGTGAAQVLASNLTSSEQATIDSYKQQQAELKEKIAENQKKLDSLRDDIAQQEAYVNTLQAQISAYQSQIDVLNDNIAFLETQQAEIQAKIDELDAEIAAIEVEINHNEIMQIDLKQEIEDIYAELEERLCEIYMYGKTSTVELLLDSSDFVSFLITLELVQNMAAHDDELIEGLGDKIKEIDVLIDKQQALIDEIIVKKDEHAQEIAALEAKADEIRESRGALEAAQSEVKALEEEAMSYLNQLDKQSAAYKAIVQQAEAEIAAFEKKIDSIISQAASRNSGGSFTPSSGLIWPLQYSDAYISSSFGGRTDPGTGTYKYHGGIDTCCWSGTYGKSVRAAASGTVIVSTYNAGGYGYYVVIDHGNGLTTVYGHNSQLLVSVGQHVNQGDVIAYAGDSGYAFGAHVHFEVRENNVKVNPLKYCSP